jgi:hypothetical protein
VSSSLRHSASVFDIPPHPLALSYGSMRPVSTFEQTERRQNAYTGLHSLKWRPAMTTCFRCGAETDQYHNGFPTCGACSEFLTVKTKPTSDDRQLPNETPMKLPLY